MTEELATRRQPRPIATLGLALAYVAAGWLLLGLGGGNPLPIWATTGIAFAGLVMLGIEAWPGVFVGSLVVNFLVSGVSASAFVIAAGNTLAAVFVGVVIRRYARGPDVFDRTPDVLRWTIFAGIVANAISASAEVGAPLLFGRASLATWSNDWLTLWMGNLGSTLVVAPPLLLWWRRPKVHWGATRILEGVAFGLALTLVVQLVFGIPYPGTGNPYPRAFLFFPIMAWSAFRLGARAAATMMFVIAAFSTWATLGRHGPFVSPDQSESLLLVQAFLATVAATTMMLSAAVHERQRAQVIAEQSEARARFLTDVSAALGASLDYQTTLSTLASLAVPRLAEWCTIRLVQEDGSIRQITLTDGNSGRIEGISVERDLSPADSRLGPYLEVIRTGRPLLIPEVSASTPVVAAGTPQELALVRSLGLRSAITLPLAVGGRTIGAMTLASSRERRYGLRDLDLADELGRRVGMAVENARLFAQAQEAIRTREDFLAIASHELRTPVTSLRLQVQIVERALTEELARARLAADPTVAADGIERVLGLTGVLGDDSRRLVRLISGLLDVTRIASGRLDLQPDDLDFREIIRSGIDAMRPELSQRHVPLTLHAPDPIPGRWDRLRLEQVVANLLSNAIKYGGGKPIVVEAHTQDDHVLLTVEDQGPGVAPEFVGRMFDRFARGATGTQGLGLGLYITRQIVESHGGTIEVRNRPGSGVTFVIRLPRIVQSRRTPNEEGKP